MDISPEKIKEMSFEELSRLGEDIRKILIETVSQNGGHLASNLGVVELTLALHNVFSTPTDSIIWDVGHQCYTHKIITGRLDDFSTLRKAGGLSGFPKPEESEHDAFIAGHSSTSVSLAHGMARAKAIKNDESYTVAVVGDGSITNGMIYEALNDCARCDERLIIILNDNEMSIGKSVGAMSRYLTKLRNGEKYFRFKDRLNRFFTKLPLIGMGLKKLSVGFKDKIRGMLLRDNFFQNFGLYYLGPCDGHNIKELSRLLERAKNSNSPVVVHVKTVKGKGYEFAEQNPDVFHGLSKFDIQTGEAKASSQSFSSVFGSELNKICEDDSKILAVTAAMVAGTGLSHVKEASVIDVGMAEEHAVTFSAGLAKQGITPVCAIYSTFLQRAYDQINHDVCLSDMHVVFAIDRAGIVGEDGETHQGVFDVAMLNPMPNLTIYSPATFDELKSELRQAIYFEKHPVAVRYPRGSERSLPSPSQGYENYNIYGSGKILIVTYGILTAEMLDACDSLKKMGKSTTLLQLKKIKPIDEAAISAALSFDNIYFIEEGMKHGSVAEGFGIRLMEMGYKGKFRVRAIDGAYVRQASVNEAWKAIGIDTKSVVRFINEE